MAQSNSRLWDAYSSARYFVSLPGEEIELAVGQPLSTFLGCPATWAVLSASNPGGQRMDPVSNALRTQALACRLQGCPVLPARGQSPDGSWVEESFFAVDISLMDAVQLARAFGQDAIVYGVGRGPAQLVAVAAGAS